MKKFLCTLLCLMLVFTMMPLATGVAFAGSKPEVSYDIWIGNTEITSAYTSDTGWNYDSSNNTLTLTSSFTDIEEGHTVDYDIFFHLFQN